MNQSDLFPPAVHRDDPLSSYRAESRATKSGKRKTNYDLIISFLNRAKYCNHWQEYYTGAEIAHELNICKFETRRRLSDAKANGDAIQTGSRICRIAGTLATTWKCI